jgi:hypothetical protein
VPVAGPAPAGSWTDPDCFVPDLSDTAARFGLVPTGASSAWVDEYVKQYLTTADYLRVPQAAGLQVDPASLIRGLLLLHPARFTCQSRPRLTTPRTTRNWPMSTGTGSWPG